MAGRATQELFGTFFSPHIFVGELGFKFFGLSAAVFCDNRRAFIVADEAVENHAKEVAEVLEENGFVTKIWKGGVPEPPIKVIEDCSEEMREFEPDLIVGVGGGSTMDLSKMAWILYESPGRDLKEVNPIIPIGLRKKAILAAFPTTAGTGSETTWAAIATDDSVSPPRKIEVSSAEIVPDFAILVPRFTAGMPPELTAGTGLDALAHAFGAYLSSYSNYYTDPLALEAVKLVLKWLPKAYRRPKDMKARYKMQTAATIAGLAFGNSQTALTHSLGHAVGRAFNVHHGVAVGIFIPYCLQYYSKNTKKHVQMARAIGVEVEDEEESLVKLVDKFKRLMDELDVSYVLKDYDINKEEWQGNLDEVAKYAYEDACTPASPRPASEEDLKRILECAYEGKDVDF